MVDRHRTVRHCWTALVAVLLLASTDHAVKIGRPLATKAQPAPDPELAISSGVPAAAGKPAVVGVRFSAHGAAIASMVFSVDYDGRVLALNPADADDDGVPDAIAFRTPPAFSASVLFNAEDDDGEIDVVVADLVPPLSRLPDGVLADITFDVAPTAPAGESVLRFSNDPAPSLGSTTGTAVPGTFAGGSVQIGGSATSWARLPYLARQGMLGR